MTEQWKPIPGFEGLYAVSDKGRVQSWAPQRGATTPRIIAPSVTDAGYVHVTLYRSGSRNYRSVHSLVAEAFIGPRPPGLMIRHLDGDPGNNTPENLAYGTGAENQRDRVLHGRHENAVKTHCKYGHEFDQANTYVNSKGRRHCRACAADWQRAFRARSRATSVTTAARLAS